MLYKCNYTAFRKGRKGALWLMKLSAISAWFMQSRNVKIVPGARMHIRMLKLMRRGMPCRKGIPSMSRLAWLGNTSLRNYTTFP